MASPTASQRYLSTRGGSYGLSFEEVVLKGLASDGGLFIPEEIPTLPSDWVSKWKDLEFVDLAYELMSLYISPSEIPDLKDIIRRSYSTFRAPNVTPLHTLDASQNLHLLELFHGPTFAFKVGQNFRLLELFCQHLLSRTWRCNSLATCLSTFWSGRMKARRMSPIT